MLVLTDKSKINSEVELLKALNQRSLYLFDTHGPNIGPIDPRSRRTLSNSIRVIQRFRFKTISTPKVAIACCSRANRQ